MREVYLKIQYLVCWAGCDVLLENRLFDSWDQALDYYRVKATEGRLSLRIEEITTKRIAKVVWPNENL